MDIFVYSDESGVFDRAHQTHFVFGGVVFLGKNSKDICSRKYAHVENEIYDATGISRTIELKASSLNSKYKGKIYRSLNDVYRFGVIIEQQKVHEKIFEDKKSKQRFLDFAYKIAVKRLFQSMVAQKVLNVSEVNNIRFYVDEHNTATNGCYELREALLQEFKVGTFNANYSVFYEPLFPQLDTLNVDFCNSASVRLVRAADIVANRLYWLAINGHEFPKNNLHEHVIYCP